MAAALGRVVGEVVIRSASAAFGSTASTTQDPVEVFGSFAFHNSAGEIEAIVSEQQLESIGRFLETDDVSKLLQGHYIAQTTCPSLVARELENLAKGSFNGLVVNWCETDLQEWKNLSEVLWDRICETMRAASPITSAMNQIGRDRSPDGEFGVPALLSPTASTPRYLRSILEIARSQERLQRVRENVADIQRIAVTISAEMRLQHTHEEHRFDYERLYIDRDLADIAREQPCRSDELLSDDGEPVRAVVVGDPGVGKSTLVRHLIHTAAKNEESASRVAPILFLCRDYNFDSDTPLMGAIQKTLETEYATAVATEELADLFNLGRVLLVLDGVDEIVDLGRRRRFIERAESFASNFPLTSIIATTRRIGYKKARFRGFREMELSEFSANQIDEYTRKWFTLAGHNDTDRAHLVRDLATVEDISSNPLMLSLLCTLYRNRGYIPRNRREVYKECAELLFRRWDSMRHIEQPFDHRLYGTRLMQELALFFYRSSAAQAGIEESQLRKIISHFFSDTASVDPEEATERAQAFLDFCADRAWLLSSQGFNDRGRKVFSFTHRTFKEYYAAEGLVRRESSLESVVDEVAKAYTNDPSSVLADVIVQCADDRYDNGATEIVARLIDRDTKSRSYSASYIPLCLRLINAAPVKSHVLDKLFSRLAVRWADRGPEHSEEELRAVLELYRDPRARFLRILAKEIEAGNPVVDEKEFLVTSMVSRWALLFLTESVRLYESEWSDALAPAVDFVAQKGRPFPEATANLLVELAKVGVKGTDADFSSGALIATTGFGKDPVPGAVLRAFERVFLLGDHSTTEADMALIDLLSDQLDYLRLSASRRTRIADALDASIIRHRVRRPTTVRVNQTQSIENVALWFSCVSWDVAEGWGREYEIWNLLPGSTLSNIFERMVATKKIRADDSNEDGLDDDYIDTIWGVENIGRGAQPLSGDDLMELSRKYGNWVLSWCQDSSDIFLE